MNSGFRVRAVGLDSNLSARQANRFVTERIDGHRDKSNADLFSRRKQHIHFAGWRAIIHLLSEINERVGIFAHRTDDHDDLLAFLVGANRFTSGGQNLFAVGDTRPAEFLNN